MIELTATMIGAMVGILTIIMLTWKISTIRNGYVKHEQCRSNINDLRKFIIDVKKAVENQNEILLNITADVGLLKGKIQ